MLHHCFTQPTKWTKKQMDWLTCGPVGQSLTRHWIYIQRPTFFFNLSASSPSASGTACSSLRRPAALFCAPRSETLPRRRPGHPSTPHLLLFSAECRPTPHPNQSSFPLLSVCDSTAASSPSPGRSSLGPRRRPPPRCSRRGMVNVVNDRLPSEEYCTWRG